MEFEPKTIDEQIEKIADIMSSGETFDFCIKGRTFVLKEDLKKYGWIWDGENSYWKLEGVSEDDIFLKRFKDIEGTWIEKIK
jgi:hypothetical protein